MSRFKLYRWWVGGRWVRYQGKWYQPDDKGGWCSARINDSWHRFHWTLNGCEREEYK